MTLALQARSWGVLPRAGGLQDQPVGMLERMATAENVYRAVRGWKAATDWAKWARANPGDWQIVQTVLKLRGQ